MADDRDWVPEDEAGPAGDHESLPEGEGEAGDPYALLSTQAFDQELKALGTPPENEALEEEAERSEEVEPGDIPDEAEIDQPAPAEHTGADMSSLAEDERLRQPRAQLFRRRLRNQIGMFPLALLLLALGGFLIARQQNVDGLPDLSNQALAGIGLLVVAFSAVFYALVGGRRDRGLLFAGLWIGCSAGMVGVLVYKVDKTPDAAEWWPLLIWSLALALLLVYFIERTHDAYLVLWSVLIFVAGGAAFAVTSRRIDQDILDKAADYWPLLLSVIGIGLLPLAFRRRTG